MTHIQATFKTTAAARHCENAALAKFQPIQIRSDSGNDSRQCWSSIFVSDIIADRHYCIERFLMKIALASGFFVDEEDRKQNRLS